LRIEARLDLHGLTQAEAHHTLGAFLADAQRRERRCVLIITGKGGVGRGGVLRAAVPRWLNEAPNRTRVLAFAPAKLKDGGAGALYVLLRRQR
jgi:DNA-nicking Smr family endonuclease